MKPYFSPSPKEKENLPPKAIDVVVHQTIGAPFAELAANLGYKSTAEVNKIVKRLRRRLFMKLNSNVLLRLAVN